MLSVGSLAFLNPWLLAALVALPVLWLLLRATPPAPARIRFPGVRLLLGLEDPEKTPHRTPWWLLLLRMAIAAAAILAFAEPVLNPEEEATGDGPVVLVMDGGWASAGDWEARREAALAELDRAERAERPVFFTTVTAAGPEEGVRLDLRPAARWRGVIEALAPAPYAPDRAGLAAALPDLSGASVVWITDGLSHGDGGALADALAGGSDLRIIYAEGTPFALSTPRLEEGELIVSALRAPNDAEQTARIAVFGRGEVGERRLANVEATFEGGEGVADAVIDLPLELRNQISRIAIIDADSAGATVLTDESVRRRRVGLTSGGSEEGSLRLISNLHYLRSALETNADVVEGGVEDVLASNPDAMVLADVGRFTEPEREALTAWVDGGGMLIRFAGPRLARGADLAAAGAADLSESDPLLPVNLRAGGRAVGGAMAWGAPQAIREFTRESPFFGLTAPREVTVTRQILARLGPDLAEKTWAALEDGTPLVTAAPRENGRVVLFHVTANAEWSSLPLSGLFVDMLSRLVSMSGAGGSGELPDEAAPVRPVALLDGFGGVAPAEGELLPVEAARLKEAPAADAPPGIYAGETTRVAYNLFREPVALEAAAPAPLSAIVERLEGRTEQQLAQWLIGLALVLLAIDLLAALWLSGRRLRLNPGAAILALAVLAPGQGEAQEVDLERAIAAANNTVLAFVITGDDQVDRIAEAGLRGLSSYLTSRTAVEPVEPIGVNLETDDLSLYPLLYWPITERQPTPSDEASARLNDYMRQGGMIVLDTRDAHLARAGGTGPNAQALRRLVAALDFPPLAYVPEEHVITRTFYLLDRFPGRWTGGRVWLQAPAQVEEGLEGADRLISDPNDGVSPVVIGAADWAAAWAVDENGEFLAPVGRSNGYRQREMAFRFGVNLVMYALTGNYKSDQVHVPALLERLGQ